MINVNLIKREDSLIGIEVIGHAQFAEHGKDLICAAVSAIVTGGFNAFDEKDISSVELKEGYVIEDDDIDYIASEEFEEFYRIARNHATRSLNIDNVSLYYF